MTTIADDNPKPERQSEDLIDLFQYAQALTDYLAKSIAEFASDHPNTEISCIGLYFTTYGSSVFINYETPTHSDALVDNSGREVQFGISKDQAGYFNSDPYDFEFSQYDEFAYEGLPNFYNAKWPIKFRDLSGQVTEVDSKDESVGRVLLASMQPALQTFGRFGDLKRSKVFRMAIWIHNTHCEAFWLHTPANDSPPDDPQPVKAR